MIILTLVSTLAAGMVWQQWRAVQVEAAERARAQATWILTGALDLGRVVLRLDARKPGVDHLGEPWATQLQEASLSSLLAQDRSNNADAGPEVYLQGAIRDAQSRFNLHNLVDDKGEIAPAALDALKRLCETAGQSPDLATTIAGGLRAAWRAESAADAPLEPRTVDELLWLGVPPDAVAALKPLVELLPESTPLNVNTASREVLAAVIPDLDLAGAERLVQARRNNPFTSLAAVRPYLKGADPVDPKRVSVSSNYFEVTGRLRAEGRVIEERMLVHRQGRAVTPLWRVRKSLLPGEA